MSARTAEALRVGVLRGALARARPGRVPGPGRVAVARPRDAGWMNKRRSYVPPAGIGEVMRHKLEGHQRRRPTGTLSAGFPIGCDLRCLTVVHGPSGSVSEESVGRARASRRPARRRAAATHRLGSRGIHCRIGGRGGSGEGCRWRWCRSSRSAPRRWGVPSSVLVGRRCRTLAATARLIRRGIAVASSVIGRSEGSSPAGRSPAPR